MRILTDAILQEVLLRLARQSNLTTDARVRYMTHLDRIDAELADLRAFKAATLAPKSRERASRAGEPQ